MRSKIVVAQQFRGPPNSGNGGYVCGLMASALDGPVTAMLRAPMPLGTPLDLIVEDGVARILGEGETVIGEARAGDSAVLSQPPPAPSLAAATAAASGFPGLDRPFHPVCFTCGDQLDEGFGLRVFVGQVEDMEPGIVAGPWVPHRNFADADGLAPVEVVWAALDCPGSVAWVVTEGGGGLLGTMTGEILRRPVVGEPTIVIAWPIDQSGRKRFSGTALYSADGELMARSHQIWIGRGPSSPE
ncbi:MAG TPA: hypothetical protein VGL73_08460 [Caulobacteraceae bacterium]